MKDTLWLKSLRELVFPNLERSQFNSLCTQLNAFYAHGIVHRESMG